MSMPLQTAVREILAPRLRADGFTGSGQNFRRLIDSFICAVNVQGSRYGGRFAINLGLHPSGIPAANPKPVGPKQMCEADCEFRRRLSSEGSDQWWPHVDDASLRAAMEDAGQLYESAGRKLFAVQTAPDAPLRTVTSIQFERKGVFLSGFGATDVRQAFTLARMRYLANAHDEAAAFARIALDRPGGALGLKRELEEIVAGTWTIEDWA